MDVKRLRRALGLSQRDFAARYRLPVGSVRNWEQGRREPDAGTLLLLRVIERYPDLVADVLKKKG